MRTNQAFKYKNNIEPHSFASGLVNRHASFLIPLMNQLPSSNFNCIFIFQMFCSSLFRSFFSRMVFVSFLTFRIGTVAPTADAIIDHCVAPVAVGSGGRAAEASRPGKVTDDGWRLNPASFHTF